LDFRGSLLKFFGWVPIEAFGNDRLLYPSYFALFPLSDYLERVVASVYVVSFRSNDDRRPSKFIVLADNMRAAINEAWEHGGADFQSRFDKFTAQAEQMKKGALRAL
jgi:hypothetical protein